MEAALNTKGFVEKHIPCPNVEGCGSSDGASKNADGSIYCFVCSNLYPPNKSKNNSTNNNNNNKTISIAPQLKISGEANPLTDRDISLKTAIKYGVLSDLDSEGNVVRHFYPYRLKDSADVSYKIRKVKDKSFYWTDKNKPESIFGRHLFSSKGKYITLVEGECDAMAAYEMLGSRWPVVSIKDGAGAAVRNVKESLEFFESFDNIVINFDSDKQGREAAQNVAKLFTPGKALIVSLPDKYKDANEMLKDKKHKDYVGAWWSAKLYTPSGVINVSSNLDRYLNKVRKPSIPYPWRGLNIKLEGIRQGELTTITGGTGLGKSTVTRELTHWLIKNTKDPIGVMALEENDSRTVDGILSVEANALLHKQKVRDLYTKEQLQEFFEAAIPKDRVWIYGHHGVTDIESIFNRLRYLVVGCGCRNVIIDHLHMLVLANKDTDERIGIDNIMGRLSSIVENTGVSIFLVSHLKRLEGNKGHENGVMTGLNHLRGSQSIAQLSHNVISIERDQQNEDAVVAKTSKVRILKCRETGDVGLATELLYDTNTGRLIEQEFEIDEFNDEEEL